MSFEFLIAVRAITTLQPTTKHVYLTLASHANSEGLCWPFVETLVKETGRSLRTVQRALTVLKNKGLIKYKERQWRSTLYWITPYGKGGGNDTPLPVTSDAHRTAI